MPTIQAALINTQRPFLIHRSQSDVERVTLLVQDPRPIEEKQQLVLQVRNCARHLMPHSP